MALPSTPIKIKAKATRNPPKTVIRFKVGPRALEEERRNLHNAQMVSSWEHNMRKRKLALAASPDSSKKSKLAVSRSSSFVQIEVDETDKIMRALDTDGLSLEKTGHLLEQLFKINRAVFKLVYPVHARNFSKKRKMRFYSLARSTTV